MSDIVHILGELATPEQADSLVRGYQVLSQLGATEHIARTDEMLHSEGSQSAFEFVQGCRKILEDVQFMYFRELRIKTSEEVVYDLDIFTDILEGIGTIMDTDQAAELSTILEDDEADDVEKLYRILSPVIDVPEDKFYLLISEVGNVLFDRMSEVAEEALPEPLIEEEGLRYVKTRIMSAKPVALKFMSVDDDGSVYSACAEHVDTAPLGYDFKAALTLLHTDIVDTETVPEKIANIFIVLCGSSIKDVSSAFPIVVEKYLEPKELLDHGSVISRLSNSIVGM